MTRVSEPCASRPRRDSDTCVDRCDRIAAHKDESSNCSLPAKVWISLPAPARTANPAKSISLDANDAHFVALAVVLCWNYQVRSSQNACPSAQSEKDEVLI